MILRFTHGAKGDDGLVAAERALALDANLAEAHAVKARILSDTGRNDEATAELGRALELDPESYEVNKSAARLTFRQHRIQEAIQYFEKSTALMETDINSPTMLTTCYTAVGDAENARRAAQVALGRAQKALALDQNNGGAMAYGANSLFVLGEAERAKEWMNRALLIDPDNLNMRYNFACALSRHLGETDAALDLLGPVLAANDDRDLPESRQGRSGPRRPARRSALQGHDRRRRSAARRKQGLDAAQTDRDPVRRCGRAIRGSWRPTKPARSSG